MITICQAMDSVSTVLKFQIEEKPLALVSSGKSSGCYNLFQITSAKIAELSRT